MVRHRLRNREIAPRIVSISAGILKAHESREISRTRSHESLDIVSTQAVHTDGDDVLDCRIRRVHGDEQRQRKTGELGKVRHGADLAKGMEPEIDFSSTRNVSGLEVPSVG